MAISGPAIATQARRRVDLGVSHLERQRERLANLLGRRERVLRGTDVGDDHDELVAADPPDEAAGLGRVVQALGDRHEELVAEAVPERVVHELEPVDVEEEQREERVGAFVGDRLGQALEHEQAVRKAGQGVVRRLLRQPFLGTGVGPQRSEHARVSWRRST